MQVGKTIYLDYQATTPLDYRVLKAMQHAARALFANPHAADHVLGWQAAAAITNAADQVGNLFGLQGDDVIFTSGATEANALAFRAARGVFQRLQRNQVLVGAGDHGSALNEAYNTGLDVRQITLDNRGAPDPSCLQILLTDATALVSIVGVNNENGAIADLRLIADICASRGVLLHVDLSQAPLAMDLDLLDLNIALATISAHKLYGPKGIGALLTGPGVSSNIEPIIVGAGQQNGRRGGTLPTELIVGFSEACRIIGESGKSERINVAALRDRFVDLLQQKQIAKLVGKLENRHPGNALLRFPGCDASNLLARVQPLIAASTQSACASGSVEPSHVLKAMGYGDEFASECIRFSFGRFSTIKQVYSAAKIITNTVSEI